MFKNPHVRDIAGSLMLKKRRRAKRKHSGGATSESRSLAALQASQNRDIQQTREREIAKLPITRIRAVNTPKKPATKPRRDPKREEAALSEWRYLNRD